MNSTLITLCSAIAIGSVAQSGLGQTLTAQYDEPTLDRWNYPFNGSPGTRLEMSSWGAILVSGFDDHDAQIILGFDTFNEIPAALGASEYRVLSATVTMTVSNDDDFEYDPTYDAYDTYAADGISFDTDPGRPLNLWLTGYRGGVDQTTFVENSAFGFVADVPPAQGMRHAFAAIYDGSGTPTDISNNLKEEFDAIPLAQGMTDAVLPGELVPADTDFSFTFTPCQLGEHMELGKMLGLGQVRFVVTSLQRGVGGPGGGEGINYPVWYSRENPIAQIFGRAAKLDIQVKVGSPADINGDSEHDFADISLFLTAFSNNEPIADLNGDCEYDFVDISAFLASFTGP